MPALTLTVQDIEILNKIQTKLNNQRPLSSKELNKLESFLRGLPAAEALLNEQFPLDEQFDIKVFDIGAMWPHLEKWITLINHLPKNGNSHYPYACWIDAEVDNDFWRRNIIIEAAFIPSFAYSKRSEEENKIIGLNLKTDGTAIFRFLTIEDAENFPELYNFTGSWKDAYLLVVKTLKDGWPQTKFPKEFEKLLK